MKRLVPPEVFEHWATCFQEGKLSDEYADELMIIDVENEGVNNTFNFKILDQLLLSNDRIIICGGIGPKIVKHAKKLGIASCMIDNRVLHNENYLKREL